MKQLTAVCLIVLIVASAIIQESETMDTNEPILAIGYDSRIGLPWGRSSSRGYFGMYSLPYMAYIPSPYIPSSYISDNGRDNRLKGPKSFTSASQLSASPSRASPPPASTPAEIASSTTTTT